MITTETFGTTKEGVEVTKYILKNKQNFEVHLLSYGLTIQKILYPTSTSAQQDIVLGFDTIEEYEAQTLYIGCIVGRNANRLSKGTIIIDGCEIQCTTNESENQLHGGHRGFDKKVWKCTIENQKIVATYTSPDLEEGFPGEVKTTVTFELTNDNELKVDTVATTNKTTVINLTRHDYLNLKDTGATDIKSHQVQIHADAFTPTGKDSLVTGDLLSVNNYPAFDLRKLTTINDNFNYYEKELLPIGYDHNFSVNKSEKLCSVALVKEPSSGRQIEILSTQPGIQFYTGKHISETTGKNNTPYKPFHGLCLETQHFPDATKYKHFSTTIITPNNTYKHRLVYKFKA